MHGNTATRRKSRASTLQRLTLGPKTLRQISQVQSREHFAIYREYVHPDLIQGWWTEELASHLQDFFADLKAGKRPKLAIMSPPQHGKTRTVEDFICWATGRDPQLRTIYASYSDELGVRMNLAVQRTLESDRYRDVFGRVVIGLPGYQCNTSMIEFPPFAGSFRNVTINGGVTGMGLNLGVVDDPIKGRQEASSKPVRDKTWNWFIDDFFSRFANDAGLLVIMTRWHVDDLMGRALERFKDFKVLRYEAIATADERHFYRGQWLTRAKGEPLFADGETLNEQGDEVIAPWKPLDFLQERKRALSEASWASLYQQDPYIVGGGVIPIEKLLTVKNWVPSDVVQSVRYWDKAGTIGGDGAYTAGVLLHKMKDGRFVIGHIARGHWGVGEREDHIKAWADRDSALYPAYEIMVEQEPGSGGKESAESTIRNLAGYAVYADKVTGSKEVRAEPFVAQVQGGNVWLRAGAWQQDFLEEAESWPASKHMDQIDAAAGAFNKLTAGDAYILDMDKWV